MKQLVIGIWLMTACACNKEVINPEVQPDTASALAAKNAVLDDYARILAKSLTGNDIRSAIRSEALQKFDGDFDILASTMEELSLHEHPGLIRDVLIESYGNELGHLKCNSLLTGDDFLIHAKRTIPNLQVAVPVHCDAWNAESFVPWVAFLPYDYDEKTTGQIIAYDDQGTTHILDPEDEPDVPVIVVSPSERIDEAGNRIAFRDNTSLPDGSELFNKVIAPPDGLNLLHGASCQLILEWNDVEEETSYQVWRKVGSAGFVQIGLTSQNSNGFENSGLTVNTKYWYKVRATNADGVSAFSPIVATTASARNDNEWLSVKRMKFSTSALKAVEKWVSGAPEIRLRIVKGSQTGATSVFTSGRMEPSQRNDIDNTWWNFDFQIFQWATETYGTVLTFDWREEDWDDDVTFTINGSYEDKLDGGTIKAGGSITISGDDGGDLIGNTSVFWWQNRNQIYNITGYEWQFVY